MSTKFFKLFYLEVKQCFRYRPVLKFELPSTYRYRSFIFRYRSFIFRYFCDRSKLDGLKNDNVRRAGWSRKPDVKVMEAGRNGNANMQKAKDLLQIPNPIQNMGSSCNKFNTVFLPYLSHQRDSTVPYSTVTFQKYHYI